MKKWMLIPAFVVACCGVLALMPHASGQTGGPPGRAARPALKVAVLDMPLLLNQYKKTGELRDEINAKGEASNTQLKGMYEKGQELLKTLKDGSIAPDTTKFRERETEIYLLENIIKSAKSSAEKDLQRQGLKASSEVYNEIQEALKLFCEHNGFTIILRIDNSSAGAADPQAVGRFLTQDVIYHNSHEDITKPVVAYLNRRYESAARSTPATSDPPSRPATQPASSPSTPPRKSNH